MKTQKSRMASTHSSLQTSCNDQNIAAFKCEKSGSHILLKWKNNTTLVKKRKKRERERENKREKINKHTGPANR
jgi:hypothetical protein